MTQEVNTTHSFKVSFRPRGLGQHRIDAADTEYQDRLCATLKQPEYIESIDIGVHLRALFPHVMIVLLDDFDALFHNSY